MENLKIGEKFAATLFVDTKYTVPGNADRFPAFGDMPPVMATAMMVAFIEETAIKLLSPHYSHGQRSVGTLVNFNHIAATPIGLCVTCEVEVTAIDGRIIKFKTKCFDDCDIISEGTHERALIDEVKFMERVNKKTPKI